MACSAMPFVKMNFRRSCYDLEHAMFTCASVTLATSKFDAAIILFCHRRSAVAMNYFDAHKCRVLIQM